MATKGTERQKPTTKKTKLLGTVAVLLSLIALVVGLNLTFSAFSANGFLKATVATNESPSLLSSDRLSTFSSTPKAEKIPVRAVQTIDGTDRFSSFTFKIYNYLQSNTGNYCNRNITYDVRVTVEGSSSSSSCTMTVNGGVPKSFVDNQLSFSGEQLKGRVKSENTYVIKMPAADVNNAQFNVYATVTDPGGTNVRFLAANFAPSVKAQVESGVTVESVDQGAMNKPNDFDGYSYDVTVSGGKADVTLSWNSDMIQLDPYFKSKVGATVNGNSATFSMDPGTMRITFYRLAGKIDDATVWDDLGVAAAKK